MLIECCFTSVFSHVHHKGSIFAFFSHYSRHHTSNDGKKPQFMEAESQPLKHLKPLQKLSSALLGKAC